MRGKKRRAPDESREAKMSNRLATEKYQAVLYLAFIVLGILLGNTYPQFSSTLERSLWPVLALLLYVTFVQIPVAHLPRAMLDHKFLTAALTGNFIFIPGLVALLLVFTPEDPAVQLGVALVLLVPCTDWFITFSHLGKGDVKYAIALAPIVLLAQFLLLPFYLYTMFGNVLAIGIDLSKLIEIFIWFIAAPLLTAYLTQKLAERGQFWQRILNNTGYLPVPLLSAVVFIIFSSQVQAITASKNIFGMLAAVFVLFLVAAVFLAKLLVFLFKLPAVQGRVLAFSFGTRNSFVVLPLALALPSSYQTAVVVVAFQPLIELIGMLLYIDVVPNRLFRGEGE